MREKIIEIIKLIWVLILVNKTINEIVPTNDAVIIFFKFVILDSNILTPNNITQLYTKSSINNKSI